MKSEIYSYIQILSSNPSTDLIFLKINIMMVMTMYYYVSNVYNIIFFIKNFIAFMNEETQ